MIHAENDWRCPVEQGQRWFVELKRRGVEAELLLFPGEGHELTRSGRPRHRVQRFEHVRDWWSRHLPVGSGVRGAHPAGRTVSLTGRGRSRRSEDVRMVGRRSLAAVA